MGKMMEAIFCVCYLIAVVILGLKIVKGAKENREIWLYGIMSLILVFGDAFHLVPRILVAINPSGDYHVSLGLGKMVTSITMTIFYLMLYMIYQIRYDYQNQKLKYAMIFLAIVRIGLCFMPQNDWTGAAPVIWGIYRNIPLMIMGVIMVVLYFNQRNDAHFKWMWLAIALSFVFYLPVVLWADVSPMIGMLMMPKTCMYIWMVVMGLKLLK